MRLSLSFSVVFPLFVYLLSGYILNKLNILDSHTTSKMNGFIFSYLFPINMFKNIYDAKNSLMNGEGFNVLSFLLVFSLFQFILTWIIAKKLTNDNKRFGAFIQGVFRGNSLLFALVIAESLLGKGNFGIVAVAAAVFTPMYNIVCVTMLEYLRGNKVDFKTLLIQVLSNPNIVMSLAAFVFILFSINVPELIQETMSSICSMCTPLALIVLGADLNISSVKHDIKDLSIGCFLKLLFFPAIAIYLGYALGFRGPEIVTIFSIVAVPSAIACYSTAFKMDSDGPFAGEMITISTLLSIFTIFIWILILPM